MVVGIHLFCSLVVCPLSISYLNGEFFSRALLWPWACLEVLAGECSYHIPLTNERCACIGEICPLWLSMQLQEGCTWSGEGGRGQPPSQPDQPNQPWQSMGWQTDVTARSPSHLLEYDALILVLKFPQYKSSPIYLIKVFIFKLCPYSRYFWTSPRKKLFQHGVVIRFVCVYVFVTQ